MLYILRRRLVHKMGKSDCLQSTVGLRLNVEVPSSRLLWYWASLEVWRATREYRGDTTAYQSMWRATLWEGHQQQVVQYRLNIPDAANKSHLTTTLRSYLSHLSRSKRSFRGFIRSTQMTKTKNLKHSSLTQRGLPARPPALRNKP